MAPLTRSGEGAAAGDPSSPKISTRSAPNRSRFSETRLSARGLTLDISIRKTLDPAGSACGGWVVAQVFKVDQDGRLRPLQSRAAIGVRGGPHLGQQRVRPLLETGAEQILAVDERLVEIALRQAGGVAHRLDRRIAIAAFAIDLVAGVDQLGAPFPATFLSASSGEASALGDGDGHAASS